MTTINFKGKDYSRKQLTIGDTIDISDMRVEGIKEDDGGKIWRAILKQILASVDISEEEAKKLTQDDGLELLQKVAQSYKLPLEPNKNSQDPSSQTPPDS